MKLLKIQHTTILLYYLYGHIKFTDLPELPRPQLFQKLNAEAFGNSVHFDQTTVQEECMSSHIHIC